MQLKFKANARFGQKAVTHRDVSISFSLAAIISALFIAPCSATAAILYEDASTFSSQLKSTQKIVIVNPSPPYTGGSSYSYSVDGDTFKANQFLFNFSSYNNPVTSALGADFLDAGSNSPLTDILNISVSSENAIGFYYFDRFSASFEATNGSYAPVNLVLTVNGVQSIELPTETRSLSFFGLISATPITSLTLSGKSGNGLATTIGIVSGIQSPSVPELSTWAMMLVGFGVIGYSRRRAVKSLSLQLPRSLT